MMNITSSLTVDAGRLDGFKSLRQFLVGDVISVNVTQNFHSFYQQLYTRIVVLYNHTSHNAGHT